MTMITRLVFMQVRTLPITLFIGNATSTVRGLKAGEEIFLDYGLDYFQENETPISVREDIPVKQVVK